MSFYGTIQAINFTSFLSYSCNISFTSIGEFLFFLAIDAIHLALEIANVRFEYEKLLTFAAGSEFFSLVAACSRADFRDDCQLCQAALFPGHPQDTAP